MKKINLISNSKKIKLEITIQNQIIWKDLDNIFCIMVLDLLSKITEDKNKQKTLEEKVYFLYYSIYGRKPDSKELQIAKKFHSHPNLKNGWSDYALALLNSPEFYFIK